MSHLEINIEYLVFFKGSKPGKKFYFGKPFSTVSPLHVVTTSYPCAGTFEFNGSTLIFKGEDSGLNKKIELTLDMKKSINIRRPTWNIINIHFIPHGDFLKESHKKLHLRIINNKKRYNTTFFKVAKQARNEFQGSSNTGTLRLTSPQTIQSNYQWQPHHAPSSQSPINQMPNYQSPINQMPNYQSSINQNIHQSEEYNRLLGQKERFLKILNEAKETDLTFADENKKYEIEQRISMYSRKVAEIEKKIGELS